MRSRHAWRIVLVLSASLIMAFMDHEMFHRPFVGSLLKGLGIFGSILRWRYMEDAERRRQTRARQQPSNLKERDASGG